jgi:hypothetical protein
MTKTATLTATLIADKPTDLLAVFDFHAVPFTHEITTDHLRVRRLRPRLHARRRS